jgi:hypothetical protein
MHNYLPRGRPYGTRYEWLETKERCEAMVLDAMLRCRVKITYDELSRLLLISERRLRDGLKDVGLSYQELKQKVIKLKRQAP